MEAAAAGAELEELELELVESDFESLDVLEAALSDDEDDESELPDVPFDDAEADDELLAASRLSLR